MKLTVESLLKAKELLDRNDTCEPFVAECGHEVSALPYSFYLSPFSHETSCADCMEKEFKERYGV